MALLAEAITESMTVTVSLKVLATMISFAFTVAGIYWTSKGRDEALEARIEDLETWLEIDFKGGPSKRGGHLQLLEKMRSWYQREQGRREGRSEAHSKKHDTLGPGHDTIRG